MANLIPVPLFLCKLHRSQLYSFTSIVPLALSDSFVLLYVRREEC